MPKPSEDFFLKKTDPRPKVHGIQRISNEENRKFSLAGHLLEWKVSLVRPKPNRPTVIFFTQILEVRKPSDLKYKIDDSVAL
jgi:hypothetical protein